MSDLKFSSAELSKFSADAGAVVVPGFADDDGGDLRGGVLGSDTAAAKYGAMSNAAEFYLDRARRGLQAFEQLSRDIVQQFGDVDNVNADALKKVWDGEHATLLANRNSDAEPPVPAQPTGPPDPAKPQG